MLNRMLGGNAAQVFLTLEQGPSLTIAYSVTEEERESAEGAVERRWSSTPVILRNDSERKETPLVLEEREPTVRGVLIVVDKRVDGELRLKLARAVATVLQVPHVSNRDFIKRIERMGVMARFYVVQGKKGPVESVGYYHGSAGPSLRLPYRRFGPRSRSFRPG